MTLQLIHHTSNHAKGRARNSLANHGNLGVVQALAPIRAARQLSAALQDRTVAEHSRAAGGKTIALDMGMGGGLKLCCLGCPSAS